MSHRAPLPFPQTLSHLPLKKPWHSPSRMFSISSPPPLSASQINPFLTARLTSGSLVLLCVGQMNLGSAVGSGWTDGTVPALCCSGVEWGLSGVLGPEDKPGTRALPVSCHPVGAGSLLGVVLGQPSAPKGHNCCRGAGPDTVTQLPVPSPPFSLHPL